MADNLKRRNATTAVGSPELVAYRAAKRLYHAAGEAAKGTPPGSPERVLYAQVRIAYQEAGRKLRESRGRS